MKVINNFCVKIIHKYTRNPWSIHLSNKLYRDFQDPHKKKVFILTYCVDLKQLYGTTLIFQSIRIGFPNATVVVVDNTSIPRARKTIRTLAKEKGCLYFQLHERITHYQYFDDVIMRQPLAGTVIILDPDIIFWEKCENWGFDSLVAGVFMPTHIDEWTQAVVHPRIHTSFFWVSDIQKLRRKIKSLQILYCYEFDPFRPFTYKQRNRWFRFDVGGVLFSAISEDCFEYGEKEHKSFDHLFGGTHMNLFIDSIKVPKTKKLLLKVHKLAVTNPSKLRGIWKLQHKQFRKP